MTVLILDNASIFISGSLKQIFNPVRHCEPDQSQAWQSSFADRQNKHRRRFNGVVLSLSGSLKQKPVSLRA
ncbi:MAG: hypothetical protein IKI11_10555 [Neisseriaceae bacterium]|nr:hypothetical protein [Neisseriaceae bacterium]